MKVYIPKNFYVVYSNKKQILIISKSKIQKTLKLKVQIVLIKSLRDIIVSSVLFNNLKNKQNDLLEFLWNTTLTLIKWIIIEVELLFYKQLKCLGTGYKILNVDNSKRKYLLFKIGYSHFLYFWNVKNIKTFCFKTTNLFMFSNCYQNVVQFAALIKLFKKPEPYKGKGILYVNENVYLKKGKKI